MTISVRPVRKGPHRMINDHPVRNASAQVAHRLLLRSEKPTKLLVKALRTCAAQVFCVHRRRPLRGPVRVCVSLGHAQVLWPRTHMEKNMTAPPIKIIGLDLSLTSTGVASNLGWVARIVTKPN